MTVNESFLGQYSVFCVFGSVVGCVIVPLIAQVIQQQVSCKDYEKKKLNHGKKQQKVYSAPIQEVSYNAMNEQHAQEYIQQNDFRKSIENERRLEEKKLKKRLKRDERLKQREEEIKREKEQEERDRGKRDQLQKENVCKHQRKFTSKSYLETFCNLSKNNIKGRQIQQPLLKNYNMYNKIPRFERYFSTDATISSSEKLNVSSGSLDNSLLSVSCSSLSSLSSSDSSTFSHKTMSPRACSKPAWNVSNNGLTAAPSICPPIVSNNSPTTACFKSHFDGKVVDSVGFGSSPIKSLGFSTSFFCSEPNQKSVIPKNEEIAYSGQYSLFGSQPFGSSLMK